MKPEVDIQKRIDQYNVWDNDCKCMLEKELSVIGNSWAGAAAHFRGAAMLMSWCCAGTAPGRGAVLRFQPGLRGQALGATVSPPPFFCGR